MILNSDLVNPPSVAWFTHLFLFFFCFWTTVIAWKLTSPNQDVTLGLWFGQLVGRVCFNKHWSCLWHLLQRTPEMHMGTGRTFGYPLTSSLSSLFSLWLFCFPLRCPNEFTGDRCQNYVMASFYSTSISFSWLRLDWSMLNQRYFLLLHLVFPGRRSGSFLCCFGVLLYVLYHTYSSHV